MIVDENEREPDNRGALESIAGKPAPTGITLTVFPGPGRGLLLAMVVNDNACDLDNRGALESIAGNRLLQGLR
jgi:hypothetical protein